MEGNIMEIADKIKNARIQKEYTQEQAAEYLFVSRQTISNWENAKSLPDIISIIRMSELYEISLDELLKGNKELMKKIERDVIVVKTEKKIIKFAWMSIVIGFIMLLLRNIFKRNAFVDFINGALPWLLLSLMFLFTILYLNEEKNKR